MLRLAALILVLLAAPGGAQAVLEPPFDLKWGDSPEKLIGLAERHRLDVTIRLPGDQPERRIVRLEPRSGFLPFHKASAIEGRFQSGRLFELSVHYGAGGESAAAIEQRFNEMKRALAKEHGVLTPNRQERQVKDRISTRTVSFHREPVKGLFLLLAYTEIEDLLRQRKEATFSLLYRNDNLRKMVEQSVGGRPSTPAPSR